MAHPVFQPPIETAAAAGLETLSLESSSTAGFGQAGLAGHDAKVRDDRTLFLHPERGSISTAVAPASAVALDLAAALMATVHRCACLLVLEPREMFVTALLTEIE